MMSKLSFTEGWDTRTHARVDHLMCFTADGVIAAFGQLPMVAVHSEPWLELRQKMAYCPPKGQLRRDCSILLIRRKMFSGK